MLKRMIAALVFVPLFTFTGNSAPVPSGRSAPAKTDVVIVGAGLSGLSAAWELKKAGLKYTVLEITPRIGGRVRTLHYKFNGEELHADSGMEEYWESNPAVQILKELKLPTRSDVALSSLVLQGKLQALGDEDRPEFMKRILTPEGYEALLKLEKEMKPIVHEIESGKISKETMKLIDTPFSEWVKARVPERVAEWIRVTLECEAGTEWGVISALDGIDEFKIFLGDGEKCYRVNGGNERFVEGLGDAVGRENIFLNKRVTRLVTRGKDVTVYFADTGTSVEQSITAKDAIVTIPLFRLFFEIQFDPPLSHKKADGIQSQTWGSYFKAHIFVPATAEKYWTKNGESILPILSDSELGVIYDGNPDQKTRTKIISLLITGANAESFGFMPLDVVRMKITAQMDKLWPGIGKEIQGMEFHRYHPRAIASWPVGRSRFDDLSNEIRRPENHVHLAGDFTENSHSDGAFLSARRAVKQILSDKKVAGAKAEKPAPEGKTIH